ncbi:hypothetical protein FRC02_000232 [Tulasnella sp. 418]|nr:hypothetical protein FRC02_000232 [Tulasnella sp. 418]
MLKRGPLSTKRQRKVFDKEIDDIIFKECPDMVLDGLCSAVKDIGETLEASLTDLANNIEVIMSVLWEDVRSTKAQLEYRAAAMGDP